MVLKIHTDFKKNDIFSKEFLIENLSHNNPIIRKNSALIIEKRTVSEAIAPLLNTYFYGSMYIIPNIIGIIGKGNTELLFNIIFNKRNKIRVRQYAIEGIGKIGNNDFLEDLYLLLKEDNIYIKKSVILALGEIGNKKSVEILLNLLERENDILKHTIIWVLGKIEDSRCVNTLIKMLSIKNLKYIIKKNIIVALGRIGDKRPVNILIDVIKDQHSGLEEYAALALEKIGEKRAALDPLIKNYLNPIYFLKDHYEKLLNKFSPQWRYLLNDYNFKIYRREELPVNYFKNYKTTYNWYYGYLNKSHYILNGFNKIVGCLNLFFLSIYDNSYLFYWDTIEIKEKYRRLGLGSRLAEFMIKNEVEKHDKFNIFLLVAKCEQYKLQFFSILGFIPVKLRKTRVGTHCIMSYPFNENSERNCKRIFEYFNWREKKKAYISSDCKYAYNPNPTGFFWCAKKKIYVTGLEKQSCLFYVKEKEIFNEKKFLNLKELLR